MAMIKKLLLSIMLFSLGACANGGPMPDLSKNGEYQGLYSLQEAKSAQVRPIFIEKERPYIQPSEYMRVWRGSYRDDKGNVVEDGWEWIKLKDEGPDANF